MNGSGSASDKVEVKMLAEASVIKGLMKSGEYTSRMAHLHGDLWEPQFLADF